MIGSLNEQCLIMGSKVSRGGLRPTPTWGCHGLCGSRLFVGGCVWSPPDRASLARMGTACRAETSAANGEQPSPVRPWHPGSVVITSSGAMGSRPGSRPEPANHTTRRTRGQPIPATRSRGSTAPRIPASRTAGSSCSRPGTRTRAPGTARGRRRFGCLRTRAACASQGTSQPALPSSGA